MSSGPVGEGQSYWCTIKVSKEMTRDKLKEVRDKIKAILDANGGKIVAEARASTTAKASFTLRPPHEDER
jgi:hypothetical protein